MLKLSKKKKDKGFTLVELIVVIAILAILVGLLAPQYTKYVEKSRKSADVSNLENLVTGLKVAASDQEYKDMMSSDVTYMITISRTNATLTMESGGTANGLSTACKALDEYAGTTFSNKDNLGKDSTLTLKSKKWANTKEKDSTIWAKVKIIGDTDAVSVEYSSNVANYSDHGTVEANS